MKNKIFYGWIVVIAAFLAILVSSIRSYAFGVFIDPLSQEFGWSTAPISLAYSISLLLTSFTAIFAGKLSDIYGVRKVMTLGMVLVVIGFLITSTIQTLYQLYLSFALVGVGASAFYVPATTTITRWFDKKKGLATGITVSALGIGMALFPPALEKIIQILGWRSAFVVIALISFSLLSVSIFLMRASPEDMGLEPDGEKTDEVDTDEKSKEGLTLKQTFKTKRFWIIYMMFMVAQFSAMIVTVHIVEYSRNLDIPGFLAATTLTAVGLANIFGRLFGGWVSDKIGVVKGTIIFFAFQSLTLFLLPFISALHFLYAVAAIFGLSFGGWVMIYPVIVSEFFGNKHSGTILGALGTVAGIGGALGPYFAGYIVDLTGVYDTAFIVGGFMTFLAMALAVILLPITEAIKVDQGNN